MGGGSIPRPGEISLAHNGVLFLDELPEFKRPVLELLREPLESGKILVSRVKQYAEFPARFQLIAAMNPCPCGYLGDEEGECLCTLDQIHRYRSRLSGPLMDRIDMQLEVPRVPVQRLLEYRREDYSVESSATVKERVEQAQWRQMQRHGQLNARMENELLDRFCVLDDRSKNLIIDVMQRLNLSIRAYHRILKLARTIADLENSDNIQWKHTAEAIQYRIN